MSTQRFACYYLALFVGTFIIRAAFIPDVNTLGSTYTQPYTSVYFISKPELVLIAVYGLMVFCSVKRAGYSGRSYLLFFPLFAGIFDVLLAPFLFMPTILKILGLLFGLLGPIQDDIHLRSQSSLSR